MVAIFVRASQGPKKESQKPKNRTNSTREMFLKNPGALPNKTKQGGKWHQKVDPKVRQNLCVAQVLWGAFSVPELLVSEPQCETKDALGLKTPTNNGSKAKARLLRTGRCSNLALLVAHRA